MVRDLFDAQRTEHDHILGAMIRKSHRLTCPTPLLEVAHMHMAIQAIRATTRP
jgi:2-dehydropantoate 2-reductase